MAGPAEHTPMAGNPKIATLQRMVTDGSCAVLSLDIFDTILWRRVPRPTDVFAILANRLKRDGMCPDWLPEAAFRRMRIAAEQAARHRSRSSLGSEVSLFDIWREMPLSLFGEATLDQLVEAEVRTEREITVVDLDIAGIVTLAQKHGVPTVFVSDTYFTEDQLAHLLDRPELGDLVDIKVFRSHEHGLDKSSGLFEIVLDQLGCQPEQVVHVGDNPFADIEPAVNLGVRAVHYERVDEEFADILEREQESLDWVGPHGEFVDPEHGDFGLTSLRAKTLQAAPTGGTTASRTAWRYGAGVLGPVMTGFAEWVAERAHQSGRSVVWCPMREGTVLSALINNAAASRGWEVEARPLWLSRHVTALAALDPADPDALREFIGRSYRMTVRQLLAALGLRSGDVPALAQSLDVVLDNGHTVIVVRDALIETPHLRNRLAVTVTQARERLLAELRSKGALDQPEIALVDLGWGGTIQYHLSEVLAMAGTGVSVAGYYLATDDRSTRVYLAGLHMEGYLAEAGHPRSVAATLSRSPEVLEQSINDLCGSLIGFAADGSPLLGPHHDAPSQDGERRAVQKGIFDFQREWIRYGERGPWPSLAGPARDRLAIIITAALKAPTQTEAALFGNWRHEDNFGSTVVTHLIPPDLAPAIPYMSPADLADLDMRDAFWPALIAASDAGLGAAARALTDGHVDPSVFETSEETSETRLDIQTAGGNWHSGGSRRVRINHNGLSFARFDFGSWHGDATALSLALPGRPAIVRVDWVEVKAIRVGQSEPEIVRWDEPEDFAGRILADATWLGGSVFEFHAAHSAIQFSLIERAGSPFSSGKVTVAFAMLPKSRTGLQARLPAASRLRRTSNRLREEYNVRGVPGLAASAARVAARQLRREQ